MLGVGGLGGGAVWPPSQRLAWGVLGPKGFALTRPAESLVGPQWAAAAPFSLITCPGADAARHQKQKQSFIPEISTDPWPRAGPGLAAEGIRESRTIPEGPSQPGGGEGKHVIN